MVTPHGASAPKRLHKPEPVRLHVGRVVGVDRDGGPPDQSRPVPVVGSLCPEKSPVGSPCALHGPRAHVAQTNGNEPLGGAVPVYSPQVNSLDLGWHLPRSRPEAPTVQGQTQVLASSGNLGVPLVRGASGAPPAFLAAGGSGSTAPAAHPSPRLSVTGVSGAWLQQ